MSLKPRVAEVRAIVPLLEGPAEDVHELAERIVLALNEARLESTFYYIVPYQRNVPSYFAFGPLSTAAAVDRFAKKIGYAEGDYVTLRTRPYQNLKEL
jgi:hypothetical protein